MAYVPTAEDVEIIERAAQTLDEEALVLRESHCTPPEFVNWDDDTEAQESHSAMKKQVADLYDLAERMAAALARAQFEDQEIEVAA